MANLEMGNVEAYVKELVAEYFGSETAGHNYSNKDSLANNSNDEPASPHGSLVNNPGQSEETSN